LVGNPTPSEQYRFFLNTLYRDTLDRLVDATALEGFSQALASGSASRTQVSSQVLGSAEYFTHLVQDFYTRFLHRAADPLGLTNAVNALEHGGTDETIIAGILGSDEYLAQRT